MYSIQIEKNAEIFLNKLPKQEAEAILKKIYSLKNNPFRFLKRLQGEKLWRLRIGAHRAIVEVVISANRIIVLRIGKRKNIYN
jgi:mRNA-degrading endonuclease RelE of RelBE toxin-antitoxin system